MVSSWGAEAPKAPPWIRHCHSEDNLPHSEDYLHHTQRATQGVISIIYMSPSGIDRKIVKSAWTIY